MAELLQDDQFNDRVRFFTEFLDHDHGESELKTEIQKMLQAKERRLVVSIDDLREYRREFSEGLIKYPTDYLPAFEKALKDVALSIHDPLKHKIEKLPFFIGLKGSFGDHHLNPRTLRASFLGKLICLEGIVTRCSLVRPKVHKSTHYCEATQIFYEREYRDATTIGSSLPTGSAYPTEDDNGNPLTTEFGLSVYLDHQTLTIQEMPERAPAGQLPRSIEVIVDNDLVDKVKAGDRIQVVGIYRTLGNRNTSSSSSTFRSVIIANYISLFMGKISSGIQTPIITDMDIQSITEISKKKNIVELLSRSLAPSIWGHDYIKKAILLMLLGGMEKNLPNGTHIRGDINVLMVGDPSTAKSQLLRFVLNIAPLAVATTGRGSSGVGLTAAVTTDKETGERRLEAGAMVLADRGIVCIDEFDKMSDIDRVAIHEVMEQQTVTIAKAGIHTSLNSRCSVFAAANPIYGQYDPTLPPHKNIALPDSLLSRFDLLFVVTDDIDDIRDRNISEHVVRMHRYIPPGLDEGTPINENLGQSLDVGGEEEEARNTSVYEKSNEFMHTIAKGRNKDFFSLAFLKKYIYYAKNRIKPVLTKGATEYIIKEYINIRNEELLDNMKKTSPVTPRTLETLIRLSTAHAKARLSNKVLERDAEVATEIVKFAMFKEVHQKEKSKKKFRADTANSNENSEDNDSDDSDPQSRKTLSRRASIASINRPKRLSRKMSRGLDNEDEPLRRSRRSSTAQSQQQTSQPLIGGMAELIDTDRMEIDGVSSQASGSGALPPERLRLFRERLNQLIVAGEFEDGSAEFNMVLVNVNRELSLEEAFTKSEAKIALKTMADANQIMFSDNKVYRI